MKFNMKNKKYVIAYIAKGLCKQI